VLGRMERSAAGQASTERPRPRESRTASLVTGCSAVAGFSTLTASP